MGGGEHFSNVNTTIKDFKEHKKSKKYGTIKRTVANVKDMEICDLHGNKKKYSCFKKAQSTTQKENSIKLEQKI